MATQRIQRVNQLIKRELSQILLKEVDFPKDVLVTATRVETSPNLIKSKIFISTIPESKTESILKILNKAIFGLQQEINKRLKMRPVPRIIFEKEEKTGQASRVEKLLEQLKNEEK